MLFRSLTVAGDFVTTCEQRQFDSLTNMLGFNTACGPSLEFLGFQDGKAKDSLLREQELLLFPTFYEGEAMPGVILEAMSYGMDVVTTNWRDVNCLLPSESHHNIDPGDIDGLAKQVLTFMRRSAGFDNRRLFLERYTYESFVANTLAAFRSIA